MHILLVPPGVCLEQTWTPSESPIGLHLLQQLATERGHRVQIFKEAVYFADAGVAAADRVLALHPDLVGFSCWCHTFPAQLTLAKALKDRAPSLPILFGGPQATCLGEKLLLGCPEVDFTLCGEAERGFVALLEALEDRRAFETVPGLCFRKFSVETGRTEVCGPAPVELWPLEDLPIPAQGDEKSPFKVVESARGCPCRCVFCAAHHLFPKRRLFPVERIVRELEALGPETRHVTFTDDAFTASRDHALELCRAIEASGLFKPSEKANRRSWSCTTRADLFDPEIADALFKAGCDAVLFGVESASPSMQQKLNKKLRAGVLERALDLCREMGLQAHCSFILGFPNETPDEVESTLLCVLDCLNRGALTHAQTLSILPGTALYDAGYPLLYDGFSTLSRADLTPEEERLVLSKPELFSSFYYVEAPTPRDVIIGLVQMINLLRQFPLTARRANWTNVENSPFGALRGWIEAQKLDSDALRNRFEQAVIPLLGDFLANSQDAALPSLFAYELALLQIRNRALAPGSQAPTAFFTCYYDLDALLAGDPNPLPALSPYRYALSIDGSGNVIRSEIWG